jgi:hypothetical protein
VACITNTGGGRHEADRTNKWKAQGIFGSISRHSGLPFTQFMRITFAVALVLSWRLRALRQWLPVYDKRFTPLKFHYLTRSYSVLPVSAVGSTGIIVRMVLPWPSERLAVPVVRVDRYRSLPSRR